MRRLSHYRLGCQLARQYMPGLPALARHAFLLGCIEPDCNPTTYVKGSVRVQRLRGHNFASAQRCVGRLAGRLSRAEGPSLLYCYRLGKLLHYMTDAFTWAHNKEFQGNMKAHMQYEYVLQPFFIQQLVNEMDAPRTGVWAGETVYESYLAAHDAYMQAPRTLQTDADFTLSVTSMAVARLGARLPALKQTQGRKAQKRLMREERALALPMPAWAVRETGI